MLERLEMCVDETHPSSQRLTGHYALIQSSYNVGYCCVMSFAAVFLLSRGLTNSQIGLTLTVASGLALLGQPMIAAFADRVEKITLRVIVAVLFALTAALSLLLLLLPAVLLPTALVYVLLVTFFSMQMALITSLAMEHINTGVPLNFSLARGLGSLAFALASLALGFLVYRYGGSVIMLLSAGIFLVGIALVLTFREAKRPTLVSGGAVEATGLVAFARTNPRFIAVVVSVALLFFSHVIINTYTIQIVEHVGGSSADMGVLTALAGFLELPAMALFPLLLLRVKRAGTIMKLSGVFLVLKTVLTLVAPSVFWLGVAQSFQFFAFALFVPSSVYYVNEVIGGSDKVKGQAYMGMAMGISGMIGNFAGGLMLDRGGVPFALAMGLVVSVVGLVLLLLVDRRRETLPVANL